MEDFREDFWGKYIMDELRARDVTILRFRGKGRHAFKRRLGASSSREEELSIPCQAREVVVDEVGRGLAGAEAIM